MNVAYKYLKVHFVMTVLLLAVFSGVEAQPTNKTIRQGNKLYQNQQFESAESKYNDALEAEPTSEKGIFNQGSALYQQEKYEEALQNFEISAEMLEDPVQKANAYHNLGNTHFKSQDLEKSIEAYKNALRLNPSDEDTRYNLALAQNMLKQQEQQNQDQNQDQDQDQNQDQQNQEDQQDQQDQGDQDQQGENEQENQQQDSQDGDQEDQQDGQQPNEGEQGEEQKPMPQPSQLSKEEVQRILEALANDENKIQEKIIKAKTKSNNKKIDKDW